MSYLLGVIYMYTSAREFLYDRGDGVLLRSALVVANACICILLVYVGSIHCVLHEIYARIVFFTAIVATAQTAAASFVDASVQWVGWSLGFCCYAPIPFIWISLQQRSPSKMDKHVVFWVCMWMLYLVLYGVLQLAGHTFAAHGGLEPTAELALTLVLHAGTLIPLTYAAYTVRAPPRPAGKYKQKMDNGDVLVHEVTD